jgi:hypothetical protein
MTSAYGHQIFALGSPDAESFKAFYALRTRVERVPHWNNSNEMVWRPNCTRPKCDAKPVYVTLYCYVTGRRGRVTDRVQYCCAEHGAAFAKKYALALPAVAS